MGGWACRASIWPSVLGEYDGLTLTMSETATTPQQLSGRLPFPRPLLVPLPAMDGSRTLLGGAVTGGI